MACVWAVTKVFICTDHKPLVSILEGKGSSRLSPKIAKLACKLQDIKLGWNTFQDERMCWQITCHVPPVRKNLCDEEDDLFVACLFEGHESNGTITKSEWLEAIKDYTVGRS